MRPARRPATACLYRDGSPAKQEMASPACDSVELLFVPSPGTPGEGQGEGSVAKSNDSSFAEEPSPQPSPGLSGKGVRGRKMYSRRFVSSNLSISSSPTRPPSPAKSS